MKIIGIICEYNPFHNGHIYHIKKIKEMYPDSLLILVLNGYFLQRGDISILTKEDKTKIALENNIDLVFELPFVFGTQSGDIFAKASIEILKYLKCEYIVFGSESNDINKLKKIVDKQLTGKYNDLVKKELKKGVNYPTALNNCLENKVDTSNDLLGISYIKAIKQFNSNIIPISIKRTNDYNDLKSNSNIISANNIRKKLSNKLNIKKYIPEVSLNSINELNDIFPYIKYKILSSNDLSIYLDVDEGLENRITKVINNCNNMDELIQSIKSKRYTYNKIKRMLIHILVGLTKEDNLKINNIEYLRLLGFSIKGQKYLNMIKKEIDIPIITNIYKTNSLISKYEIKSNNIYNIISKKDILSFENNNKPIKKV